MKKNKKIIYAVGLHTGGGSFIFNYLKNRIISDNDLIFVDERLKNPKIKKKSLFITVKNSLISKLISEYYMGGYKYNDYKEIIFMNGLPPIFNFSQKLSVYFQNANILYFDFNLNFIFSLNFLRAIKFHLFKNKIDKWIVFSKYARKELGKYVDSKKITIENIQIKVNKKKTCEKIYDFVYPASGELHKNHKILIEALIILSKKKIYPKILLTLKKNEIKKLKIKIYKKKYNLKIFNIQNEDREKFIKNYNKCKALIYPSYSETLGLPLLEAKKIGIDILASNLDFAREYTTREKLFNPYKARSLASVISNYVKNK